MRCMRSVLLLLTIAIITPAFAANPDFKDWERSPQGYFMTKAERLEWTAIKTQEEAQRFIDQFLAKRVPTFAADVAERAANADKYLTVAKLPGSKTLRGKVVILLGVPSAMDVFDVADNSGVHHDSPLVASAYTGGSASGGISGDGGGDSSSSEGSRSMGGATLWRNYHFTYASSPAGPLDLTIATEAATGKDRPRDRNVSKQLDAAFEAAAQASIKTK